ncbi:MAG: hypothetical protein E7289_09495 [Lachnospiraceae bacterium]|nr:hypothetical protein [Lachnospiraceae bacterium]
MNQKQYTPAQWAISIVFIIWFVASIAGLLLTAKSGQGGWALAIFGQYFIVIGMAALVNEIKQGFRHPIVITFPLVGFTVAACALIWQYGSDALQEQLIAQIPNIACGLFAIVGLLCLSMLYVEKKEQKKCTYVVQGRCVDVKQRVGSTTNGRANMIYCPVFEYFYNGQTYVRDTGFYTNLNNTWAGEYRDIYINPDKPEQFYEPGSSASAGYTMLIIGIMFIAVSAVVIWVYNFM